MGVSRLADFQLEGLDDVLAKLERWGDGVLVAADEAVTQAAGDAADLARAAVAVDTGALQRSITSEHVSWGLALVEAGEGIGYARTIEAHSGFFNRSVDTIQQELRERVSGAIVRAVF